MVGKIVSGSHRHNLPMQRILVIGASGNIGRHVVSQLAATGAQVRAMSRTPGTAALSLQVETMVGDLTVPETLDKCLSGVDSVFLLWTAPSAAFPAALERITSHARRVVFLSAPIKTPHPLFAELTGTPARPFLKWATDHAAEFRG